MFKDRLVEIYATKIYPPASALFRRGRRLSQRLRGKAKPPTARTHLPVVPWQQCVPRRVIRLYETKRAGGNVRLDELAILAYLAADCEPGSLLFEIGTFDGRTALNLAMNAPDSCQVLTLDLPRGMPTRFKTASSDRKYIDKPKSGSLIEKYVDRYPHLKTKIKQLLGDSAAFDFSPFAGACSLIFVDGSHAYEYVVFDTAAARRLVRPGGVIIWHDYGIWTGVTRALEELAEKEACGLYHISGTSLVYWRSAERSGGNEVVTRALHPKYRQTHVRSA